MNNPPSTGSLAHKSPTPDGSRPSSLHVMTQATRKKRVVFISCEAGGGHKAAARALTEALHRNYPDTYETATEQVENMIGPAGRMFGTIYSGSYNLALQGGHYWLEPVIFGLLSSSRTSLLPFGVPYFRKALAELAPDLLVMLIHGSHEVLDATMKIDGHVPNLTVVTDAVSIRPSWAHPHCDQVVVSTPEAKEAVIKLGIAPEKIELIGHPIDKGFSEPPRNQHELRRRYFLQPDMFTIMMMMGGTGGRNIYRFSKALIDAGLPVQILACCGSDAHLYSQMQHLAKTSPIPIKPYAYTTEIPQLMAASDLLVTKPGPGTIMEAMAMELPIILDDSNYTMWQEKGNVDFVRQHNLGRVLNHTREFVPVIADLLAHPEHHAEMKAAVKHHQRVDSSTRIAELIHERLSK